MGEGVLVNLKVSGLVCPILHKNMLGHLVQLVAHLTQEPEVLGLIPGFVSPSAESRRAVVSYWRKYVPEALVNRLAGLSLPRKSLVILTYHPNMAIDVYRGR